MVIEDSITNHVPKYPVDSVDVAKKMPKINPPKLPHFTAFTAQDHRRLCAGGPTLVLEVVELGGALQRRPGDPLRTVTRIWTLAIWTSQDNSPCRVFFQTQQVNWMIFFFGFSGSAMLVCLLFWFIWNQELVGYLFQDNVDHVFLSKKWSTLSNGQIGIPSGKLT